MGIPSPSQPRTAHPFQTCRGAGRSRRHPLGADGWGTRLATQTRLPTQPAAARATATASGGAAGHNPRRQTRKSNQPVRPVEVCALYGYAGAARTGEESAETAPFLLEAATTAGHLAPRRYPDRAAGGACHRDNRGGTPHLEGHRVIRRPAADHSGRHVACDVIQLEVILDERRGLGGGPLSFRCTSLVSRSKCLLVQTAAGRSSWGRRRRTPARPRGRRGAPRSAPPPLPPPDSAPPLPGLAVPTAPLFCNL